jgi:hypothetical protein
VLLESATNVAVLKITTSDQDQPQVSLVAKLRNVAAVTGATLEGTPYAITIVGDHGSKSSKVHLYDLTSGSLVPDFADATIDLPSHRGKFDSVYGQVSSVVRKDVNSMACRLFLAMEDHSTSMLLLPTGM